MVARKAVLLHVSASAKILVTPSCALLGFEQGGRGCPGGWTLERFGFLFPNHSMSKAACIALAQALRSLEAMTRCRTFVDDFDQGLVEARIPLLRCALRKTRSFPDAEDLVQATLLRALLARDQFTPGTNLIAWLYQILNHLFIDLLRAERPTMVLEESESTLPCVRPEIPDKKTPFEAVVDSDFQGEVKRLREPYRTTFEMYYFERRSYEEIAEVGGTGTRTVGVRLYRARQSLASTLRPWTVVRISEVKVHAQVW